MPRAALSYPVGEFAERIVEAFDRPLFAGSREHRVKISTGVAIYPENGRDADELLSNGHLAFCRAKGPRRGGHVMFDNSMRQELEARVTLEAELALAVERGEFELFYQPQVHLADGRLSGAEALIRWRHPERGLVAPIQFMPVVNSSAISERIAVWVMETACRQARQWELAGHGVRVGINLSPSQLQSGDLARSVADMLAATGLSAGLLELEVTEDILLQDEARVLETFQRIQQLGVRVVFDDFGTGYASLSYLKKFPLDGLKIDKSFVFELLTDSDDAAIVNSTVGLEQATRPVRDRRRHREPRQRRSAADHGLRGRAGLLLRQADAGRGLRSQMVRARGGDGGLGFSRPGLIPRRRTSIARSPLETSAKLLTLGPKTNNK